MTSLGSYAVGAPLALQCPKCMLHLYQFFSSIAVGNHVAIFPYKFQSAPKLIYTFQNI